MHFVRGSFAALGKETDQWNDVVLQASLALFAAALTGWFAVQIYYQQREHELIIERYLEGGIDLLAAEMQRVITIFNHNWALA